MSGITGFIGSLKSCKCSYLEVCYLAPNLLNPTKQEEMK